MTNNKLNAVEVCEPLEGERLAGRSLTPISRKTGKSQQDAGSTKLAGESRPFEASLEAPFLTQGKRGKQGKREAGATKLQPRRKDKRIDAAEVWKQMEDVAVPRLGLTVYERIVYSHLLRHSRLEGKVRIRFGIQRLAEVASLSDWAVRKAVRGLAAKGALRLAERSKKGHVVEVRLPEEIRGVSTGSAAANGAARVTSAADLDKMSFWETPALREAIHAREAGGAFIAYDG